MDLKKFGKVIGMVMIAGGLLTGPVWSADLKVGWVDIQKAVNECNAGKEAKKAITKEMEKLQKQFNDRQKELQGMKEALDKQSPMLTVDARQAKEKEFQGKVRDYQRWLEDNQKDIQQKGMEMEKNIGQGLLKLIQKVGADEGYTFILEKNDMIVLYATKAIDMTDRVIKAFDAQGAKPTPAK
jgi:outer membrane protein